jgi:type I restriction enzyme R subunit
VLRFHVDYFKPDGSPIKPGETPARRAVVEAILAKHDAATNQRKFNTLFATASIDDAIDYFRLFREVQAKRVEQDEDFVPLNIACVFSPPAEGNRDVAQLQEDLPQELEDNKKEPGRKKAALVEIIADYNARYGANQNLANFDSYYQDVQQRIKDQKYPNSDLPRSQKIDITIVVDMLLTGFDSAYLNTLYVDKNLKYHGLIQAFSRTNRVLNDSKPYGNILDFRAQRDAVDEAIALFSGEAPDRAKEVWLVDPAPKVIGKLEEATQKLTDFMAAHELQPRPDEVSNLKGDEARVGFIERFKEVKRLTTQLDQYTDLTPEQKAQIEALIPRDDLRAFSAQYLETARRLQQESRSKDDPVDPVQQLDFEFVLFDSALIDYDYIMRLIARFSQAAPKRLKMTREELKRLLASSARLMEEREDLEAYIATLKEGEGLSEEQVRKGYEHFKAERQAAELALIAEKHNLSAEALQRFVDLILDRYIFDPDALSDLFRPRGLGWKARAQAELALMEDITPLLRRKAEGREISGLEVYEEY